MAIILRNGSGFQIYLPGLDDARTCKTEKTAPFTLVRTRILYVDDEWQAVEMGRNLLEHLGYRVTALTSSLRAREVFHDDPQEFDLVITDLNMPVMSGLELAADLVKVRPDLPIILFSGCSDLVSPEIARKLNIRELLRKPTRITDFVRVIRRVLDSGKE